MLKNYEKDLEKSKKKIISLSEDIYSALELSYEGFKDADIEKLSSAKSLLKESHDRANKIDNEIIKTLALFSPEASDLRVLIAYLKITNELSRISDYVKTHTKAIKIQIVNELHLDILRQDSFLFHQSTLKSFRAAIDSLSANEDSVDMIFRAVNVEESKCDDIFSILEKSILEQICVLPEQAGEYIVFLNSLRKLERVSDRSVNIVKLNYFAQKGGKIKL